MRTIATTMAQHNTYLSQSQKLRRIAMQLQQDISLFCVLNEEQIRPFFQRLQRKLRMTKRGSFGKMFFCALNIMRIFALIDFTFKSFSRMNRPVNCTFLRT